MAEADLLCDCGAALRICRRGERVGNLQSPSSAIFGCRLAVAYREVAAEHLAAKSTVKANHEVPAVGSVDGNGGCGRGGGLRELPECGKGTVDDGDKVWEITRGDAVVGNVATNNLGDEMGVDRLRFSHHFPLFWCVE